MPLKIKELDHSIESKSENNLDATFSKMGSQHSRTAKVSLGYKPIPFDALERSCTHLLK